MEVDLTDDDIMITPALPKATASALKVPQQCTPTVETVDITDDDDIIFESNVPFKDNASLDKSLPSVGPAKSNTTGTNQTKTLLNEDKIDLDDVIEVLDVPSQASGKDKPVEPQDKVKMLVDTNVLPKALKSPNKGIREVLGKPDNVSTREIINPSKGKVTPACTTGRSNTEESPHWASSKDRSNLSLENLLQGVPSAKSKVHCPPKNSSNGSADKVIDLLECPFDRLWSDMESRSLQTGSNLAQPNENSKDQPKKTESTSSASRYVVDITDDNSKKEKDRRKPENTCLNVSCKSGEDLSSAPMFVISYYGCKLKKGKHDVCAQCFDAAVDHHKRLAGRLILQQPLLAYENFPVNDIPMVDLESDEETSETEEPLPFSLLQDVEDNLEEVLKESLRKYDVDYQITEATGILSEKITALELGAKGIDAIYNQFQKEIDEMRYEVYRKHEPPREELPSLEITAYSPPILFQNLHQLETPPFGAEYQPQIQRGVAIKKVTQVSSLRPISPTPRPDGSSQEVVALEEIDVPQTPLPPIGNLVRPKPRTNDVVFVMKMSFFGVWLKGRVIDVTNSTPLGAPMIQTVYKVKMEIQGNRKQFSIKTVTGRHMAYPNPAPVRLTVGIRVIAVFQDDESTNQNKGGSYYSGIIAEPPKSNNRFRYLVFFDDGYAQYVPHNKILVVCESSRNVWDDIHPDSQEFIRKYLEKYPERPMVKLAPNQVVKTEWNGKWWIARVVEVDGSLVKMSFDADKRTEWIYRGSTRLAPLFTELSRQESGTISRMRGMGVRRVNQPYVEYTHNTGAEDDTSEPLASVPVVRAVAKKSTSKKHEIHMPLFPTTKLAFFSPDIIGMVKELQLPKDAPMPKRFQSHSCGPQCIDWIKYDAVKMRSYNPLSVPLYCGWQRELPRFRKKSTILYTAPCGRRLRNMQELHKYLRTCRSHMSVDLFDFDYWVNALSEFALSDRVKQYIVKEDISCGRENVKIPLVNYVDHSLPTNLIYKTQRQPYENVFLNNDPSFLCGCDCTDDCQNKEKCACWQLTVQGSALYPGGVADPDVGYYYKRLQERVITGIYECNEQCKCSKKTCLNRVVQHPLQLQLQLFKTPNKGWGLRCVNDIPKGTFICIYAGYLYTEQTANSIGEQDGDDYLAELDYIEVVERMKEDYESDVEDAEEEDEDFSPLNKREYEDKRNSKSKNKEEVDTDFKIGWRSSSDKISDASIRSRLRKRSGADLDSGDDNKNGTKRRESSQKNDVDGDDDASDDDKDERLPSSFTPKPLKKSVNIVGQPVHRFQSVRKFYGLNERVYIMDANKVGNIGRYLNHSCSPNVFVQNVFVDTHDLRFPWVAFFALTYIKAGSELTWDYNYDVGSVPGKTIICQCESSECRGRLL